MRQGTVTTRRQDKSQRSSSPIQQETRIKISSKIDDSWHKKNLKHRWGWVIEVDFRYTEWPDNDESRKRQSKSSLGFGDVKECPNVTEVKRRSSRIQGWNTNWSLTNDGTSMFRRQIAFLETFDNRVFKGSESDEINLRNHILTIFKNFLKKNCSITEIAHKESPRQFR